MPFEKVDPKVDFPAQERHVLAFWERIQAFERLRAQNAGRKRWSFLDGPITANNPMGVHHAWGRTYKDVFCRYHAAKGFDQRYQNGFDCQGLWVEVEVEKEHGFSDKRQIEEYGIGRFVEECKARATKFAAIQSQQSIRLGYWMDWNNSYYTMSEGNNYGIWAFLKKCHHEGLIYKGSDVMAWCPRCGTGISQMEMNEGYRETEHLSVFVRFPLGGRTNEALLVWTTTPWTLTSNVAAAVRPGMPYVKVKSGEWTYYVGKTNFEAARKQPIENADKSNTPSLMSLQAIFRNAGGFEVVGEVDGAALVGLTYDGPFDHLPGAAAAVSAHQVIAWDQVTESEGSGIVHIAPGCGSEDYHLGKSLGLPSIAPLEENGRFKPGFGELSGQSFRELAETIANDLKSRGLLVARERYVHRYPHCWRCKEELVYRLVDEWFINMNWRERIMDAARTASWIPEWGLERELDWLRNMGDWMISKKRYWGLALPIWECGCGAFEVIGSRDELRERATAGWAEFDGHTPHRPYVDAVKIKCGKCGNASVSRIKDVGNPWLDASMVSFSTMGYFEDRAYWEKWFPADFVVESLPGQFRNWFYALLAVSTMMVDRSPFKTLLGHGLVLDDNFEEMHKSKGNAIWFDDAAEQIGADTMRWMFCSHAPERNLAFGPKHADETRKRIVIPLWNIYKFLADLAAVDRFDPNAERIPVAERSDLDRWILSDLQLLIEAADRAYSSFDVQDFCQKCERFVDDLSTWYVRRSRRRFYDTGWPADKRAAYATLYEVLDTLIQLVAPILPFTAETMYQNLVVGGRGGVAFEDRGTGNREQGTGNAVPGSQIPVPSSVHHRPFPTAERALVNEGLSGRVSAFLHVVSLARSVRTENKLKVRQPLAELLVVPGGDDERAAIEQFRGDLLEELNVKNVSVRAGVGDLCRVDVKLNLKLAGPKYGKQVGAIQKALAAVDPAKTAARVAGNDAVPVQVDGEIIPISPDELLVTKSYDEAWAGAEDGGTIVLLDRRVTEELKREGLARDVVRNVQNLRKDAGLNIEDRIRLSLDTDAPVLQAAIKAWQSFIVDETLAVQIEHEPLADASGRTDVQIEGMPLAVALRRD